MEDFSELFSHEGIDAGLAASIFHYKEIEDRRSEEVSKKLRAWKYVFRNRRQGNGF